LEKKREADRRYRRNNREKRRRSNLEYRRKNKDKVKLWPSRTNKLKNKKYHKKYYDNNKEKIKGTIKIWLDKKKERLKKYKINIGCQICGYKKCSDALDFHHPSSEQKIIDVSRLTRAKWEIFLSEAKKCMVVCRNCHAEIHYKLRNNIA
jgi:hypothetical protein